MLMQKERELVVQYCQLMLARGLTRGTGGNISICSDDRQLIAISPSGMDYPQLTPADVVVLGIEGEVVEGSRRPSSEAPMHRALYKGRADVAAVVHTHSTFACTLACLGLALPPLHPLIGFAGDSVRCTKYAPFGSDELAVLALEGMRDRYAVLLGNHGLLASGPTIEYAFTAAEETEFVCELYCRAKTIGTPLLLSDGDVERLDFTNYLA